MINPELIDRFRVQPGTKFRLKDRDPGWAQTKEMADLDKDAIKEISKGILANNISELAEAQDLLYADDRYGVLVILQGMDASGKDSAIKHVLSGVNPHGCQVFSFKTPSAEELDHNFLWRHMTRLPERGRIGIFNRSYYEDVLIVKVHPELLDAHKLPRQRFGKEFWKTRYGDINAFEQHLVRNGILVLKFMLHISKKEQKRRFLDRLDRPEKHWKFCPADVAERAHWDDYMEAYEEAIAATSTDWAPWYIVPADNKWVSRAVIAAVLTTTIRSLDLKYPEPTDEHRRALVEARRILDNE